MHQLLHFHYTEKATTSFNFTVTSKFPRVLVAGVNWFGSGSCIAVARFTYRTTGETGDPSMWRVVRECTDGPHTHTPGQSQTCTRLTLAFDVYISMIENHALPNTFHTCITLDRGQSVIARKIESINYMFIRCCMKKLQLEINRGVCFRERNIETSEMYLTAILDLSCSIEHFLYDYQW